MQNSLKKAVLPIFAIFAWGGGITESYAVDWMYSGETGNWEDRSNWNADDYIDSTGNLFICCDKPLSIDCNTDVSNSGYTFFNGPDLRIDFHGRTFKQKAFALAPGNSTYNDKYPKVCFANATLTHVEGVADLNLRIQPNNAIFTGGEFRFESVVMPKTRLEYIAEAPLVNLCFTNSVLSNFNVHGQDGFSADGWTVRFEDSILTNVNLRARNENPNFRPSSNIYVRSFIAGGLPGFTDSLVENSTVYSTSSGFSMRRGKVTGSTMGVKCAYLATGGAGNLVEIFDSRIAVTNMPGLQMFNAAATNNVVHFKNTVMENHFDESVTDSYWGTQIGYNAATTGCVWRLENSEYRLHTVNGIQARIYFGNMAGFTLQAVGGGNKIVRTTDAVVPDGKKAFEAWLPDGVMEFVVPKNGMDEPGLEISCNLQPNALKYITWVDGSFRIRATAQAWVMKTGGEVCLLRLGKEFSKTILEKMVADDPELPEPARPEQAGMVKLEVRENADANAWEVWLTAPKAPKGTVVVVR